MGQRKVLYLVSLKFHRHYIKTESRPCRALLVRSVGVCLVLAGFYMISNTVCPCEENHKCLCLWTSFSNVCQSIFSLIAILSHTFLTILTRAKEELMKLFRRQTIKCIPNINLINAFLCLSHLSIVNSSNVTYTLEIFWTKSEQLISLRLFGYLLELRKMQHEIPQQYCYILNGLYTGTN